MAEQPNNGSGADPEEEQAPPQQSEAAEPEREASEPTSAQASADEAGASDDQAPVPAAEGEPAPEPPAEPVQPEAEAPAEPAATEPAPEPIAEPDDAEPEAAQAPPAREPAQELSAKELRRTRRSKHVGEARAPRSPEERHAERLAARVEKSTRRRARRQHERSRAAERGKGGAAARAPDQQQAELAPVHATAQGKRKVRQGIVISDKAAKTIVVRIDVARRHRRYEKIVRGSSTLHAHDENNDAREGDVVRVIESRPLSRTKRWALVEVLERAR